MNHHQWLLSLKPGDVVTRMLGGTVPMHLKVSKVETLIHCGPWTFSRNNGAEIDEGLGWTETRTGSFIKPPPQEQLTIKIHGEDADSFKDFPTNAPTDPV